jgi:hypothetical protein
VVVNVPFAFGNGSQHFTAGLYSIRMDDQRILVIHGESRSDFAPAWFQDDSHPVGTTKVVFLRCGDQDFLHVIWVAGESSHTYCLPSKAEEREMAAGHVAPLQAESAIPNGICTSISGRRSTRTGQARNFYGYLRSN